MGFRLEVIEKMPTFALSKIKQNVQPIKVHKFMKPRTLAQALREGYKVHHIYGKYNKQIRVDLQEIFHKPNRDMFVSFWIDRDYFSRNYPNAYSRF